MVTSSINMSHQRRCLGVRPVQSTTSNLLNLPAKYISATAITSGSHCRQSVVHKLSPMKNKNQISNLMMVTYSNKIGYSLVVSQTEITIVFKIINTFGTNKQCSTSLFQNVSPSTITTFPPIWLLLVSISIKNKNK